MDKNFLGGYTLGPDVDLEKEVILDSEGRRIDEAYVKEVVAEVHRFMDDLDKKGEVQFEVPRIGEVSP